MRAGGRERQAAAVAGDREILLHQAAHAHLHTFERGIHVARCAARVLLFAQHVPGLDGLPQLHFDAFVADASVDREAEFDVRREPRRVERIAGAPQVGDRPGGNRARRSRAAETDRAAVCPIGWASLRRACSRTRPPARAPAVAAPGSCARAAAFRRRAAPAVPGVRTRYPANRAYRCRTRHGACCRSRPPADCGRGDRPSTADTCPQAHAQAG